MANFHHSFIVFFVLHILMKFLTNYFFSIEFHFFNTFTFHTFYIECVRKPLEDFYPCEHWSPTVAFNYKNVSTNVNIYVIVLYNLKFRKIYFFYNFMFYIIMFTKTFKVFLQTLHEKET